MPSVADTHPIALGPVELVAYKAKGTVWIGIRPQGSSVGEAIGLHTGSNKKHYLEATAAINGTWGVAFGAVSPEVERLEVRNERGESFPGRIIPLPGSFEEEYRTAWGVATVCKKEGRLIGHDDRGRSSTLSSSGPGRAISPPKRPWSLSAPNAITASGTTPGH
jgi:hypothetical protein